MASIRLHVYFKWEIGTRASTHGGHTTNANKSKYRRYVDMKYSFRAKYKTDHEKLPRPGANSASVHNPLKSRRVNCQLVTLGHPGVTYIFNFLHLGTLALSPERQSSARVPESQKLKM